MARKRTGRKRTMLMSERDHIHKVVTERYGNERCFYCTCDFKPEGMRIRTLEHRIPFSELGQHYVDDFVYSCLACNTQKGTMSEDDFLNTTWLRNRRKIIANERERAAARSTRLPDS